MTLDSVRQGKERIDLILPENAPEAFHLLAKPTGAICNLDCAYCFFLDKEVFYPGSNFRMSDEVLERYIRQLIESHQVDRVNIAWQGGEPTLMGLDFYRRAMELAEEHRRPGMTFLHTMQTNGTLLDDEWCAFFKAHNFLIGISIDGPRKLHDVYRVDKGGAPTFDNVMRGLRLLQKHEVDYNILTRTGLQCAPLIHEHHGTSPRGTVRFSIGAFNTEHHIEAAVTAVAEIAATRRVSRVTADTAN